MSFEEFNARFREGWVFRRTELTEEYTFESFLEQREESVILCIVRPDGSVNVVHEDQPGKPVKKDTLISFGPPAD